MNLKEILKTSFELDDTDWEMASHIFFKENIVKGKHYLREKEYCTKLSFVVHGLFRVYTKMNHAEKTVQFFAENDFMTDYFGFLTHTPSIRNIQALEDATILSIQKDQLINLYCNSKKWERLGRILAESAYLNAVIKNDRLLQDNYNKRVKSFIHEKPEIIQRVPQYMIASYLNMTPETFSRVKKRIYESIKPTL
jgi:CRP/FNR family transcriptional regulator, anaerobic regulatory protein